MEGRAGASPAHPPARPRRRMWRKGPKLRDQSPLPSPAPLLPARCPSSATLPLPPQLPTHAPPPTGAREGTWAAAAGPAEQGGARKQLSRGPGALPDPRCTQAGVPRAGFSRLCIHFYAVLRTKARASHVPGKCSPTQPRPQPQMLLVFTRDRARQDPVSQGAENPLCWCH